MADVTFIFHSDWLDCIKDMPVEQQDAIIGDIIRYGAGRDPMHTGDAVIQMGVNFCKNRIDFSKDKYAQKVEAGKKNGGSNKKYTDQMIYEASQGENSSKDVAIKLGCSKSTIDHSYGWTKRNEGLQFNEDGSVVL